MKLDAELASIRAAQRRLFALTDEIREHQADLREALLLRDRAIERLELKLRRVNIELSLERLRREGEQLPPAPRELLDVL